MPIPTRLSNFIDATKKCTHFRTVRRQRYTHRVYSYKAKAHSARPSETIKRASEADSGLRGRFPVKKRRRTARTMTQENCRYEVRGWLRCLNSPNAFNYRLKISYVLLQSASHVQYGPAKYELYGVKVLSSYSHLLSLPTARVLSSHGASCTRLDADAWT